MLKKLIVDPVNAGTEQFAEAAFNSLTRFSLEMLGGFVSIWFIYTLCKALISGSIDFVEVGKKLFLFTALIFLINGTAFKNFVYMPIKKTTNVLVTNVLSITGKAGTRTVKTPEQAVDLMEDTTKELVDFVATVQGKAGFGTAVIAAAIFSTLLGVLFTAGEAIYAYHMVGNTLKLSAMWALSPLLIVAFGFGPTRGHALGALRYVLCSALTLVIASFCVGLVLYTMRTFFVEMNTMEIDASQIFLALSGLFVVAITSIYFLLIAPEMASAIAGAQSSSIISGFAGAAVTGGLGFIASKASGGVLGASKIAGGIAWSGIKSTPAILRAVANPKQAVSEIAQKLRDRFSGNNSP